jgi:hypothetical protein
MKIQAHDPRLRTHRTVRAARVDERVDKHVDEHVDERVGERVDDDVGDGLTVARRSSPPASCPLVCRRPVGHERCAVSCADGEAAVGCEREVPALLVESVVVVSAQWEQVDQVGVAAVFPVVDVVCFGDRYVSCAAGDCAGAIHGA